MAFISKPIHTVEGQRRGACIRCLLSMAVLCWCRSPVAGEQALAALRPGVVTTITVERNCSGCATGSILVLRRNAPARFTVTGNPRHGTEDRVYTGALSAADFDALARLAVSSGFFEMDEAYQDPDLQDGQWTTIGISRSGLEDKRVFIREDAGPASLKALEVAIEARRSRIPFVIGR